MARVTPERITHLEKNEVFVFGSNLAGAHGGGAALIAYRKFGAIWGQGVPGNTHRLWHRRIYQRRDFATVRKGSRCREYRAATRLVRFMN